MHNIEVIQLDHRIYYPHRKCVSPGPEGRLHPAITRITTTHEVKKMRPHVKMLCGNYLTFEIKSVQSGGSADCRICSQLEETPQTESLEHLISRCVQFDDIRTQIKEKMMTVCRESKISIDIYNLSDQDFTQFALDPSSMNLKCRVAINHPALSDLFQHSRDFCYAIDQKRTRILSKIQ